MVHRALLVVICISCISLGQAVLPVGEPARESEAETIARCLKDLGSKDVLVRRRAALLLGKYSTPEAIDGLVSCLRDEDGAIRLGALVSLTEERALPESARALVFELVTDPDVHVRRMASSMLPSAMGVRLMGNVRISGNVRIRSRQLDNLGEDVKAMMRRQMLAGLEDEDASVRKNVLSAWRVFGEELPRETLKRFLTEESAEIRMLAVSFYSRLSGVPSELLSDVRPLAKDSSAEVRGEVCRFCGMLGIEAEAVLRVFLSDEEAGIRVSAVGGLVGLGVKDGLELLRKTLLDETIPSSLRKNLVYDLNSYPQEMVEICKALLDGKSSEMAVAAIRLVCRPGMKLVDVAFLTKYLDSPYQDVSQAVLRSLRMRLTDMSPADVLQVLGCKNRQAKEWVLTHGLFRLDKEAQSEILSEACLDSDQSIRLVALRQLGRYRVPGWEEILVASLEDEDGAIRQAAATDLCRAMPTEEIQAALRAYLPQCTDEGLKQRIERYLKRRVFRGRTVQ